MILIKVTKFIGGVKSVMDIRQGYRLPTFYGILLNYGDMKLNSNQKMHWINRCIFWLACFFAQCTYFFSL